jgi:hypothetical protein
LDLLDLVSLKQNFFRQDLQDFRIDRIFLLKQKGGFYRILLEVGFAALNFFWTGLQDFRIYRIFLLKQKLGFIGLLGIGWDWVENHFPL